MGTKIGLSSSKILVITEKKGKEQQTLVRTACVSRQPKNPLNRFQARYKSLYLVKGKYFSLTETALILKTLLRMCGLCFNKWLFGAD